MTVTDIAVRINHLVLAYPIYFRFCLQPQRCRSSQSRSHSSRSSVNLFMYIFGHIIFSSASQFSNSFHISIAYFSCSHLSTTLFTVPAKSYTFAICTFFVIPRRVVKYVVAVIWYPIAQWYCSTVVSIPGVPTLLLHTLGLSY